MKKIALLTVLGVLLVTTFSCSKNETTTTNCKFENSTIVGKWKVSKFVDSISQKEITQDFLTQNPTIAQTFQTYFGFNGIEFKSDSSAILTQVSGSVDNMTWKLFTNDGKNYWSNLDKDYLVKSVNCKEFVDVYKGIETHWVKQ